MEHARGPAGHAGDSEKAALLWALRWAWAEAGGAAGVAFRGDATGPAALTMCQLPANSALDSELQALWQAGPQGLFHWGH
eukprot:112924-Lingulodinium_polyedra.AAC.1